MLAGIYKPGQGYWTRVMSAIGAGVIVLMGAVWLWDLFKNIRVGTIQPVLIQFAIALLIVLIFGALTYYLIGVKPRVVDFMIATEAEMKKVNWSTRREIIGSTWVVIGLTFIIGVLCYAFDWMFATLFSWMRVLEF